jgi:hypothetical protein
MLLPLLVLGKLILYRLGLLLCYRQRREVGVVVAV